MSLLIKNIRVVDAERDFVGSVICEEGKISQVFRYKSPLTKGDLGGFLPENFSGEIIDGTGKILMPGFWDPHVHFRDPGFTYKEDFHTGTKAALSAGVTTIFDMPNTKPATFTREILDDKRKIAEKKAVTNWGLYFGAGTSNLEEIKKAENVPGTKLYLNTTTGNLKMDDEQNWREIFRIGRKVSLHAEGETFFRAVDIWVEENFPCEIHLCHASLKTEIEKIESVREKFPEQTERITVEVCPHHLFLTDKERLKHGAFCCMKPELATEKDLKKMWEAIEEGTIDFFATDHAPHTKEEKEKAVNPEISGPFGIPGVETFLPLLFTAFVEKNLPLTKLAAMTSKNPQEIFHVEDQKGLIQKGFDADFVILDPNYTGEINPEKFHSKSKWSPFAGRPISVKIEKTILAGKVGFDQDSQNFEEGLGKEINFKPHSCCDHH